MVVLHQIVEEMRGLRADIRALLTAMAKPASVEPASPPLPEAPAKTDAKPTR